MLKRGEKVSFVTDGLSRSAAIILSSKQLKANAEADEVNYFAHLKII